MKKLKLGVGEDDYKALWFNVSEEAELVHVKKLKLGVGEDDYKALWFNVCVWTGRHTYMQTNY